MYDNEAMRNKKIRIIPREIFDNSPARQIMEDAVVKRYDGFMEVIPKRVESVKRKCIFI